MLSGLGSASCYAVDTSILGFQTLSGPLLWDPFPFPFPFSTSAPYLMSGIFEFPLFIIYLFLSTFFEFVQIERSGVAWNAFRPAFLVLDGFIIGVELGASSWQIPSSSNVS